VKKYQKSLKRHYNKSVVRRQLEIDDLVLKKDIHTKDRHKLSSPGDYVLVEVDDNMLTNTYNID
jgi:hypothetical protein